MLHADADRQRGRHGPGGRGRGEEARPGGRPARHVRRGEAPQRHVKRGHIGREVGESRGDQDHGAHTGVAAVVETRH